jgi:hypothetical protein
VPGDDADEPLQPGRVRERSRRQQALRQPGAEGLLAGDAVEVAGLQPVPLPDERERFRAADGLPPGGQVHPGVGVAHRCVQAHGHPAERVGELHEPREVDLGEMVDADAGQGLDSGDQRAPAGLAAPAVQLGAGDALRCERLLGVLQPAPVR